MDEIMIQCQDVWKYYGKKEVLKGLSFQLTSGRIVGLLGPNGAGKTTLMKLLNGLLRPESGTVLIGGEAPGVYTKSIVSYLPDRMYFAEWMKVRDMLDLFQDFYEDFDRDKAEKMCGTLQIRTDQRMKILSKGTREKVQLILVMSRRAKVYLLDEPIAGVDPAARDYILGTIQNNYNPEGPVLISTHLISDVERILDEVIFMKDGQTVRQELVDDIREKEGKSVDGLFRELFRMEPFGGGAADVR